MRRNHQERQIIGDPTDHIQTRSSLRSKDHTTLTLEMELKHIGETNKELSEPDDFFVELRLEEGISDKASINTNTKVATSSQYMDDPQEEVREPNGRIMRRNHPKSHIIGDPIDHV